MTGYLIDYRDSVSELPPLLEWDIRHTLGKPCDAFEITFAYRPDMLESLRDAVRFRAEHEGETVFTGVVDEFEVTSNMGGLRAGVRGRGLAALLMDNEAQAAQYFSASAQFILDRHVYPFGIKDVRLGLLPSAAVFTVESGASQWSVLENFAWFIGGVRPRFSPDGALILREEIGRELVIDAKTGVSEERYREARYGVISRALVQNRVRGVTSTVDNRAFMERGGSAQRVVSVPRYTGYDAMRHTGEYQIARSEEESVLSVIKLPKLFAAFPGDRVRLLGSPAGTGVTGEFTVGESRCAVGANMAGTTLTLLKRR